MNAKEQKTKLQVDFYISSYVKRTEILRTVKVIFQKIHVVNLKNEFGHKRNTQLFFIVYMISPT